MGVSFHAAGLAYEDSYDCGCVTYGGYRMALARRYHVSYYGFREGEPRPLRMRP